MKSSYTLGTSEYQLVTCKKCKMAEKAHTFIYKRADGEGTNICVQVAHSFLKGAMPSCLLCDTFVLMYLFSYAIRVSGRSHTEVSDLTRAG